ncbi:MAG: 6-carboxytetrahydropterin synthase [Phycisphaerae bacterium]|jgi:6-pyruvoyltetrahydropterin/6-carboxytetrahydropterin synthase
MRLRREIRFSVGSVAEPVVANSWAGWPAAAGLQPFAVLSATVAGRPDPQTGYLCDIRDLDRLLRERSVRLVERLHTERSTAPVCGERLIRAIADDLAGRAPPGTEWVCCRLQLTPFLSYETGGDHVIRMTQCFEFAAAHRLHCPQLSEARNREIFGKCNNPNGHGHNYILEVTLAGRPDPATGLLVPIQHFEQVVRQRVLDRLDHKHLNLDCPEFADLNPSVENIARVIWTMLDGRFEPARLAGVRVWETAKTCAEYDGSAD